MGTPGESHKVKLIVGMLCADIGAMDKVKDMLTACYGPVDFESPAYDFTQSDYYSEEMGSGLQRRFISFQDLLDPKDIYKIKLNTNALEDKLLKDGKRSINIDPGYLDLAKLVLLSTKDYTHRIYLDGGIYAEVTLFYKDRRFNAWPWTYPDYKSEVYLDVFEQIRDIYGKRRS